MIQKRVIDAIYRKCRRKPASPDELNIPLLFEAVPDETAIEVSPEGVVIGSLPENSPFRSLPICNIHGILNFDEVVAIVLRNSIVFISKYNGDVNVHLRGLEPSFLERLRMTLSNINVA